MRSLLLPSPLVACQVDPERNSASGLYSSLRFTLPRPGSDCRDHRPLRDKTAESRLPQRPQEPTPLARNYGFENVTRGFSAIAFAPRIARQAALLVAPPQRRYSPGSRTERKITMGLRLSTT